MTRATLTFGSYLAFCTSLVTVITFTIAYFTPPLSGPLCREACFSYPFTEIVSRFPRDYIWMYPAMMLMLLFAVLVVFIYHYAAKDRKIYSHVGVLFAFMSALVLVADYFLQVSVIQPSLLLGETDGVAMLTQYNSHGVFIVLEDLGYILTSFALLSMAPVFSGSLLKISVRWIFILAFILNAVAFTVVSFQYGINREYRFEIATISINWLAILASGILLGILFRRDAKEIGRT